ncbi:DNA mismatch repair protein MutT [Sporolactobacillus shoreicorticis]|uniref:DNA mismatch repair protein MutT n=1 Tax=Sporolactobacillus shoreicorticis TaxID=1923877 RepID=A0ABW5S1B9_9BACL
MGDDIDIFDDPITQAQYLMGALQQWLSKLGCSGIAECDNKMIIVDKTGSPYIYRYARGSQEAGESLLDMLHREFNEETGMTVSGCMQIGTFDFFLPWK